MGHLENLRTFLYENEKWARGLVTVWYSLIVSAVLLEAYTVLDGRTNTPPLTHVIVREVPWWVTMPVLIWLPIHFGSRYLGRPIL